MKKILDYSLYLVTSEEYSGGKSTLEIAGMAISGGVDVLQMREKHKSREELIVLGNKLSVLCSGNDVTFIVNDSPDIAREVAADGVHLGQEDLAEYTIEGTRDIMGEDKIIGISTHSVEQFEAANRTDCDYIAFGPIFHTETKDYSIGMGDIKKVLDISRKPVILIGGINLDNVDVVLSEGARNIAVIRAIAQAEDIKSRVEEFRKKINEYGDPACPR